MQRRYLCRHLRNLFQVSCFATDARKSFYTLVKQLVARTIAQRVQVGAFLSATVRGLPRGSIQLLETRLLLRIAPAQSESMDPKSNIIYLKYAT